MMEVFSPRRAGDRFVRIACLASAFLALEYSGAKAAGLLNGDFTQATEHWTISFPAAAKASVSVSPEEFEGKPALVVALGESKVSPWLGKFVQTVELAPGSYTIAFLARAEPEKTAMELSIWSQGAGKSKLIGKRESFTLNPGWEEFLYTFVVPAPGMPVNIVFGNLARSEKNLSFTSIRLTKD